MNCDLNKWLKKDLCLPNVTESDLNGLMFHPRHGGLCRKLVKFLAESTLCSKKYPAVFAKENFDAAKTDLDTKTRLLRSTISSLRSQKKECKNTQMHVEFLSEKLNYIKEVKDCHINFIDRLGRVDSEPNRRLEQVRDSIKGNSTTYIANNDLTELYVEDLKSLIISQRNLTINRSTTETSNPNNSHSANYSMMSTSAFQLPVLKRQQSQYQIESEYDDLVRKIGLLHRLSSRALSNVLKKINELDYEQLEIKHRPRLKDLQALKMPECVEVFIETDKEERELTSKNEQLQKQVIELEAQCQELAEQIKQKQLEIMRKRDDKSQLIGTITSALRHLNMIKSNDDCSE